MNSVSLSAKSGTIQLPKNTNRKLQKREEKSIEKKCIPTEKSSQLFQSMPEEVYASIGDYLKPTEFTASVANQYLKSALTPQLNLRHIQQIIFYLKPEFLENFCLKNPEKSMTLEDAKAAYNAPENRKDEYISRDELGKLYLELLEINTLGIIKYLNAGRLTIREARCLILMPAQKEIIENKQFQEMCRNDPQLKIIDALAYWATVMPPDDHEVDIPLLDLTSAIPFPQGNNRAVTQSTVSIQRTNANADEGMNSFAAIIIRNRNRGIPS